MNKVDVKWSIVSECIIESRTRVTLSKMVKFRQLQTIIDFTLDQIKRGLHLLYVTYS